MSEAKPAEQSGGVVPEFEDLKVAIRTIKIANPEMGVAKVGWFAFFLLSVAADTERSNACFLQQSVGPHRFCSRLHAQNGSSPCRSISEM